MKQAPWNSSDTKEYDVYTLTGDAPYKYWGYEYVDLYFADTNKLYYMIAYN